MSDWISVKDRFPESKYQRVLVHIVMDNENRWYSEIGIYRDGKWDIGLHQSLYARKITHWMPLPNPPEVKND